VTLGRAGAERRSRERRLRRIEHLRQMLLVVCGVVAATLLILAVYYS
jgi:hypothetical protein